MNFSLESDFSLYQVIQQLKPSTAPLIISTSTLKSLVGEIIDIIIEEKLSTQLFVKFPQTKGWFGEIERYYRKGYAQQIYLCDTTQERQYLSLLKSSAIENSHIETEIIPIKLKNNKFLKKESFLIILSSSFSIMILSQWQVGKIVQINSSGKRVQEPHLKTIYSFEAELIQETLKALDLLQVESEPQPRSLVNLTSALSLSDRNSSKLIADLLLAQIRNTIALEPLKSESKSDLKLDRELTNVEDDFLSNLVRELRAPLTHMKTALSLLESKHLKKEQRERYLQLINRECDRQNSLINGLMELVQLDHFSESETLTLVKLEELVPGIVSTYQPLAEEKGIQLGYTIPANLPPASCPPNWLRQILINLLNNSLQYTLSGGRVSVVASAKNEWVELTVSDTGVGVDRTDLGKIFNSFYRGKNSIEDKVSGAGLGLTIVQQLAQRCGGSISVNSKLGKGSSFKVSIPILPVELIEDDGR